MLALGLTLVVPPVPPVVVLLAVLGSNTVGLKAEAEAVSVPVTLGMTVIVRFTEPPDGRFPMVQVTTLPTCVQPALAEEKFAPTGMVKLVAASVTSFGPAFATVMV